LATVTAIIDGTGSIGAVVGPAATGLIAQFAPTYNDMFSMLYLSAAAATALLTRLTARELRSKWATRSHEHCRDAAAVHPPPSDSRADPSDRGSLDVPLLAA
jgi:nitrate/nitrite transporter NarK